MSLFGSCSISDCSERVYARGWCNKHYQRWLRHGDPERLPTRRKPGRPALTRDELLVRIAERTVRGEPDDCWTWIGTYGGPGKYPEIASQKVARILLGLAKGDGLHARHTCDHPWCVNPSHLITGTPHNNHRDMVQRGRSARGEKHWNWKGGGSKNYRRGTNRMEDTDGR